jgi:hypothetical protein
MLPGVSRPTEGANPLACLGAPLEYWFFKFHVGERLGFLVDFILRRRTGSAEVRISYWLDGAGQVVRPTVPLASSQADGQRVSIAGCTLVRGASRGSSDSLSWDLVLEAGPTSVDPRNALLRWLRPLDMELCSWPRARVSGNVRVGDQLIQVPDSPALITHYWGRRLPRSWCWLSANQFAGEPDCALEAMVLRSGLWGLPGQVLRVGYFFLERGGRRQLIVSPLDGAIQLEARPDGLALTARPFRGPPVRLSASATPEQYNDLGENIRQTLLASFRLDEGPPSQSLGGLEWRGEGPLPIRV